MARKQFVDANGRPTYYGDSATKHAERVAAGDTEIASMCPSVNHRWNGAAWVLDPPALTAGQKDAIATAGLATPLNLTIFDALDELRKAVLGTVTLNANETTNQYKARLKGIYVTKLGG